MELQHVNAKFFLNGDSAVEPFRFIELFHKWIREQALDGLLIDVADYRHVPAGPGVMLIAHEADYAMESTDDRCGLRYNRKAALAGDNQGRFRQACSFAARACLLLEAEFAGDGLKFIRNELELTVNDRALAPNTPETYAACKPELEGFLKEMLGHAELTMDHDSDPRRRFGVTVKTSKPFDLSSIADAPSRML